MARILYVEDEPVLFMIVERRLAPLGHVLSHATDDESGLELARTEPFDLILLDIQFDNFSVDGWEINRLLKADPRTRDIPVICLSGHAGDEEFRQRALSEGFVDHVAKPIVKQALLAAVAAQLPQKDEE